MNTFIKQKLPVIIMICVILIIVVAISVVGVLLSHHNYKTITQSDTSLTISPEDETSINEETDTTITNENLHKITVTGDIPDKEFDAVLYTKWLYELKELFAVDKFDSILELSTSKVVQYAFCHLYYSSLVDMPEENDMLFRQVLPESISEKINEMFGENSIDVTKSDLYNSDKNVVEMWQPKLRNSVYANTVCKKLTESRYQITAKFYSDENKTKLNCVVVGIFEKQNDGYILVSLHTA